MMCEELLLRRDGQLRCRIPLSDECLSIGAAQHCDWMIHDTDVPAELVLVQPYNGQVRVYDLRSGAFGQMSFLALNVPYVLHPRWTLERSCSAQSLISENGHIASPELNRWELSVGRGQDARRFAMRQRPISIGKDAGNDVVLRDMNVDQFHCRLEPHREGWIVRDLGSKKGIWIEGHRIVRASLHGYTQLRIGHTDLFLRNVSQNETEGFVAASDAMRSVLERVRSYAEVNWPLLVLGETGVGKEEIAKAAHRLSPRSRKPFVAVNAGGLPANLVESELFGHERGAFTSAHGSRRGVFEQAEGGTLFLDEVGELPLDLQSRLLRVLETQQVRRVGAESEIAVDFRLVCATHRDLRHMVAQGQFRQDLYHRIHRLVIEVPPLRSRITDVVPLAEHFLMLMQKDVGCRVLSEGAQHLLRQQPWYGNARELRNVVSSAALETAHAQIDVNDIERAIISVCAWNPRVFSVERLNELVTDYGGNIAAAARSLGIPRTTLRDRLKQPGRGRIRACGSASQ